MAIFFTDKKTNCKSYSEMEQKSILDFMNKKTTKEAKSSCQKQTGKKQLNDFKGELTLEENKCKKQRKLRLSRSKNAKNTSESVKVYDIITLSDSDFEEDYIPCSNTFVQKNDLNKETKKEKDYVSLLQNDWKTPENSPEKCKKLPDQSNSNDCQNSPSLGIRMVSEYIPTLSTKADFPSTDSDIEDEMAKFDFDKLLPVNGELRTPPSKSIEKHSNASSPSLSCTPPNSTGLATPESTPSPFHQKVSPGNTAMSKSIYSSPEKFGIKTKIGSGDLMCSNSLRKTPRSTYKSVIKSSPFHNSSISSNVLAKSKPDVRRNLSFDRSSETYIAEKKMSALQFRETNGLYLDNFQFIINFVLSQPFDCTLLNEDDLKTIENFKALSLQAKKLYIRLFQRKLKWNRVAKIEYNDICDKVDISLYVNELTYAKFLLSEAEFSQCSTILPLLSVDELRTLCKEMKLPSNGKKENLIDNLLMYGKKQKTIMASFFKKDSKNFALLNKAKTLAGHCCIINKQVRDVFTRILTLFSLPHYDEDLENGQQSQLFVLLLVNLGKIKFPDVSIIRTHSPFQTREDLQRFDEIHQLENEIRELCENKKWEEALIKCDNARDSFKKLNKNKNIVAYDLTLPVFLRKFTSLSLLLHILSYAVEAYQKLKNYKEAVILLEELLSVDTHLLDYRGRWFERLALNWDQHLKNPQKSLQVIQKALEDPNVRVGHRLSLCQRVHKILNSKRGQNLKEEFKDKFALTEYVEAPTVTIYGKSFSSDQSGFKRVFISTRHKVNGSNFEREEFICSVEEFALYHYRQNGYIEGLHCEGRTIAALFGLLFWDIIYSDVPNAFRSSYQGAPLDLDCEDFYKSRKDAFNERLKKLKSITSEEIKEIIQIVWSKHEGKTCIFDWNLFRDSFHTQGLVDSLGMDLVCAICERLAIDHRFTRSGFPDLVVWNPEKKDYCIVEVKGPNDKLSTKQILWLDYLIRIGAKAEVCYVEEYGSRSRQIKRKPSTSSPKAKKRQSKCCVTSRKDDDFLS